MNFLLVLPFLAAAGAAFLLAPHLWEWYSPLLGMLALGIGLSLALPVIPVMVLRRFNPPTSAFMLQTRARWKRQGQAQPPLTYDWVNLTGISPQMCLAVIVAEDFTFPVHRGIVPDSVRAARAANQQQNRDCWRGGSTITQQLVKNLFLWPARSFVRKAIELYCTLWVELLWSKRRIMEVYLNIVQFGDTIFGVQAAAHAYFAKPASQLTAQECALLAAALPNPALYRVREPSPQMRFRQTIILSRMNKLHPLYMDYMRQIGLLLPEAR